MSFIEGESVSRRLKVLWVDDQDYLLRYHTEMLEKGMNGEIELVSDAREALEILEKQAKEGLLPDIIVSDFSMPHINGLEFAEAVRDHENERIKSLPFCITSSFVTKAEQERLNELGIPILGKDTVLLESGKIRQIYEEGGVKDEPIRDRSL